MGTSKAKHEVGDGIHVKLLLSDDRCCMAHYGTVTDVRIHQGAIWKDRVLYNVHLEQADAPDIIIQNLPHAFTIAGDPEESDHAQFVDRETMDNMHAMCEQSLPPDLFETWVKISDALKATRKAFKETA
jgi:hypothetical protein